MESPRDMQPRFIVLFLVPSSIPSLFVLALRNLPGLTRRLAREAQKLLRQLLPRRPERVRPRTAIATQRRPGHGRRREIRRHQLVLGNRLHWRRLDGSLVVVIAVFFWRRGRKAHVSLARAARAKDVCTAWCRSKSSQTGRSSVCCRQLRAPARYDRIIQALMLGEWIA